ncbi:hypothetical protein SK128_021410, partial [Halocaridina rubra]
ETKHKNEGVKTRDCLSLLTTGFLKDEMQKEVEKDVIGRHRVSFVAWRSHDKISFSRVTFAMYSEEKSQLSMYEKGF